MSLDINQIFQYAAPQQANTQNEVFINETKGTISSKSNLSGLSKLSNNAKAAEKSDSIQAFINAIEASPLYHGSLGTVVHLLRNAMAQGKGLTKELIFQSKKMMETEISLNKAQTKAAELVSAGTLEQKYANDFAHYSVAYNFPLETQKDLTTALQALYEKELFSPQRFTIKPLQVSLEGLTGTTLKNAIATNENLESIFTKLELLDVKKNPIVKATIAEGIAQGKTVDEIRQNIQAKCDRLASEKLTIINELNSDNKRNISHIQQPKEAFTILEQAINNNCLELKHLNQVLFSVAPLSNISTQPADVRKIIQEQQLNVYGTEVATPLLEKLGLPTNLAAPLSHFPTMVAKANELLNASVPPPALATATEAKVALEQAFTEFMIDKKENINQLITLSNNPPLEMKRPLTPERLPQLINAMLTYDDVLAPLFDENVKVDLDFLEKAALTGTAFESCTHGFKGEFGSQDVVYIRNDVIALCLNKRGVSQDELPQFVEKARTKFSSISSELGTLTNEVGQGRIADGLGTFGHKAMVTFSVLNGFNDGIINNLSQAQLLELGFASTLVPNDKELGERVANFSNTHYQKSIPKESLSQLVRDFGNMNGLNLDPIDTEILQKQFETEIKTANGSLLENINAEFFYSTGNALEAITPSMNGLLTELVKENPELAILDLTRLNTNELYISAFGKIENVARTATREFETISRENLIAVLKEDIKNQLAELKTTIDTIMALPETDPQNKKIAIFTPAEKAQACAIIPLYGIRDANTIQQLILLAKNSTSAMKDLALPRLNHELLGETIAKSLSSNYFKVAQSLGDVKNLGSDGAMLFSQMAIQFADLSPAQVENLRKNITSPEAFQFAAACNFIPTDTARLEPQPIKGTNPIDLAAQASKNAQLLNVYSQFMAIPVFMEGLKVAVHTASNLPVELSPLEYMNSFSENPIAHIGEIPAGIAKVINKISQEAITPLEDAILSTEKSFTGSEMQALTTLGSALLSTCDPKHADLMAKMFAQEATEILAAYKANNSDISTDELWTIFIGSPKPKDVTEKNLGQALVNTALAEYGALRKALEPSAPADLTLMHLNMAVTVGLSFKNIIALNKGQKPSIEIADVQFDLNPSSLRSYHAGNGYGLPTDFRRMQKDSVLTFNGVNGESLTTQPYNIPDNENVPTHPTFTGMIQMAESMTQSEAQKSVVLQAFTQSSCVIARIMSSAFIGDNFDEHGGYNITATQQADNSVLIDISAKNCYPFEYSQQWSVGVNGECTCTDFHMAKINNV